MRTIRWASVVLAASIGAVAPAWAVDQPLQGAKLVLRHPQCGPGKLVFVARSPAVTVPAVGSPDDPATGAPGGATVEVFSGTTENGTLAVPAGAGVPGWSVETGRVRYVNPDAPLGPSPVRVVSMVAGRKLKILSRTIGIGGVGPQGRIAIRITTGSLRQCALFEGAAVRTDTFYEFAAGATPEPSATFLPDCSDATLAIEPPPPPACTDGTFAETLCGGTCPAGSACGTQDLSTCICIDGAQPCGDTAPVCNGQCPSGEECLPVGGFPLPGCACLPENSVACSQNVCGGVCPSGQECNFFSVPFPGGSGCQCGPPGPCGSGGDDCPSGFQCVAGPGGPPFCAPIP